MKYTKKEMDKKKKNIKGKKSRGGRRGAISLLKIFTSTFLIIIALCLGFFAVYAGGLIARCPNIEDVDVSPNGFITHIMDANGQEIETLAGIGANREYVTLDHIPKDLQHAFVAIEDRKFYTHNGIDPAGIVRAGVTGILKGGNFSQGASTITQQLLKNNFFSGWTSEVTLLDRVERKIQEQYLAMQLEKVMSKEDILENYLNTINLGQNTLGVESAALRYFNKNVDQLTLSESAVIAGITQNPTRYNPIKNPEENSKRRKKVLDDMLEMEFIDQKEHDAALADDVYSRIEILNSELESGTTSYFVDALCEQIADDLMEELGYSESEAYSKLYSGGLEIRSTLNPEIQAICDEEVNDQSNYGGTPKYSFSFRLTVEKPDGSLENFSEQTMLSYYKKSNSKFNINYSTEEEARNAIEKYKSEIMEPGDTIPEAGETINITLQPQVAMSIIDQSTGQVQAIVGGRGDKTASRTLNRATGITRQPGSTFKIVAAYAPALDAGGMSLSTAIDDEPTNYSTGKPIRNYDGRYRGPTTIRTAITYSINVVAVKCLTEIGTGLGLKYAEDLGISTLENTDNNQALALGGITYGVKNIELAGAYATIANGGLYNRPSFYTQVLDNRGKVLLDTTEKEPKEVLKPTTAWLLTDAMKDVMTTGTGTPANFSGMTLAAKSGTTTSNRDTLFAGFSPYYTCVIWGGYDDNAVQNSTAYSKAVWKAVMSRIHKNLPNKDFEMPSGITQMTVCGQSGKLPIAGVCDAYLRTEYFANDTAPTERCSGHSGGGGIKICSLSGLPAGEYCPSELIVRGVIADEGDEVLNGLYPITRDMLNSVCNIHTHETVNNIDGGVETEGGHTNNSEHHIETEINPSAPTTPSTPAQPTPAPSSPGPAAESGEGE